MGKEHFEEISIVLILFKKRIEIQIYVDTVCCMLIRFSCGQLFATLWTVSHQAPLSMGFSRQEYWSGLLCSPPADLPNLRIEPASFRSPALAGRFFTTSTTWEAPFKAINLKIFLNEKQPK